MSTSAAHDPNSIVIDLAAMRRRLGSDDELIREILAGFLVALPPLRAQLEAAATKCDQKVRARAAHALRGALLDIAALPAAELARRIEFASDDCAELLASLSTQLDAIATTAARIVATG